ncbi:MAG TPA: cytochrome c assembly protein [Phaeodactylibacter sp.]|nr:cytochrome c assembly protein [Phaeodactylibacter sp.]
MEKKYWWKMLSVPILLYVIIIGLTMPLSTGIVKLSKSSVKTGETFTTTIETYNTFLTQSKNTRAWLKKGKTLFLAANNINVIDDNHAELTFSIPSHLPTSKKQVDFAIIIDDDHDGYGIKPNAIRITQTNVDSLAGTRVWKNSEFGNLSKRGTNFPYRGILFETIRNLYFHVPMWFTMLFLFIGGTWNSFQYLRKRDEDNDLRAEVMTFVGLLFGIMGLATGMLWAKSTWGTYWTWKEIKLNMTAIALLLYFAYFVLRNAFDDLEKRARISAVYNLFAFVSALVLINVIPRLTDSLHPGNGGNPALGGEDLDGTMRMVFYPAIIGWTLLGFWIATIYYRMRKIQEHERER